MLNCVHTLCTYMLNCIAYTHVKLCTYIVYIHVKLCTYIVYIHCVHTLCTYIVYIHCVHTLCTYIVYIHCVHTVIMQNKALAFSDKNSSEEIARWAYNKIKLKCHGIILFILLVCDKSITTWKTI